MSAQSQLVFRISPRLRARREELGLSRAAVAARAGVDVRTVARMESGNADCLLRTFGEVARVLGTPAHDLVEFVGRRVR